MLLGRGHVGVASRHCPNPERKEDEGWQEAGSYHDQGVKCVVKVEAEGWWAVLCSRTPTPGANPVKSGTENALDLLIFSLPQRSGEEQRYSTGSA